MTKKDSLPDLPVLGCSAGGQCRALITTVLEECEEQESSEQQEQQETSRPQAQPDEGLHAPHALLATALAAAEQYHMQQGPWRDPAELLDKTDSKAAPASPQGPPAAADAAAPAPASEGPPAPEAVRETTTAPPPAAADGSVSVSGSLGGSRAGSPVRHRLASVSKADATPPVAHSSAGAAACASSLRGSVPGCIAALPEGADIHQKLECIAQAEQNILEELRCLPESKPPAADPQPHSAPAAAAAAPRAAPRASPSPSRQPPAARRRGTANAGGAKGYSAAAGGTDADERLAALYQRNTDWRRRCEEKHSAARREREGEAISSCTFSPSISPVSRRMFTDIVRIQSPLETTSPRRTGAAAAAPAPAGGRSEPRSASAPRPSHSSAGCGDAAAAPGPRCHSARRPARDEAAFPAAAFPRRVSPLGHAHAHAHARAPGPASQRLYDQAAVYRSRHEAMCVATLQAEREAREWMASKSARGVAPRVYQQPQRAGSPAAPTTQRPAMGIIDRRFIGPCINAPRTFPAGPAAYRAAPAAAPRPAPAAAFEAEIQQELGRLQRVRQEHVDLTRRAGAGAAACALPAPATPAPAGEGGRPRMWVRLGQSRLEETWNSFIERQQTFLEGRAGKIQRQMGRQEEEIAVMPKISPGSKRILQQRQRAVGLAACLEGPEAEAAPAARAPHTNAHPHVRRVDQQLRSPGSSHGGRGTVGGTAGAPAPVPAAGPPSPFSTAPLDPVPDPVPDDPPSPEDSAAAPAAKPARARSGPVAWLRSLRAATARPRGLDELSEGERRRRERKLAEARAAKAAKELEGVTFRPQLSAGTAYGPYAEVRPKLLEIRTAPELYMAHLAEKQRRLEIKRASAIREKEEQEMAECTFTPKTRRAPHYLFGGPGSAASSQPLPTEAYGAAELVVQERLAQLMQSSPVGSLVASGAHHHHVSASPAAAGALSASMVLRCGGPVPGSPTAGPLASKRRGAAAAAAAAWEAAGDAEAIAAASVAQRRWQQHAQGYGTTSPRH